MGERNEREEIAKAYLEKAKEHLKAAKISLEYGLFRDAISRAYYSVYSAAYSILYLLGKVPKTHAGLRTSFSLLVREGVVEVEYGKIISKLYEMRETSDYDPISFYGEEEAEQAVSDAERFLFRMEGLFEEIRSRVNRGT